MGSTSIRGAARVTANRFRRETKEFANGIQTHVYGDTIGALIHIGVDPDTGRDKVDLYLTAGFRSESRKKLVATFLDEFDGPVEVV